MGIEVGQARPLTDRPARPDNFQAEQGAPHADEIRRQLGRIVGSAAFRDSLRLTRFLTFVVEATLAGKGDRIKAYTIAVEALGRGGDFDLQADPIVRVEAGRLRQALARYYSGAGGHDPLVIDVPRGGYVPIFRPRDEAAAASSNADPAAAAPCGEPAPAHGAEDLLTAALRNLVDLLHTIPALVGPAQNIAKGARHGDAQPQASDDWHRIVGRLLGPKAEYEDGPPAMGDPDARTAAALQLISMLDELSAQLLASQSLKSAVAAILEAAIYLHRPDFGHVQLFDERTNSLVICAQRGFNKRFLKTFERVSPHDGCASGRALRDRVPVIVEDVLSDAEYSAFRTVAAEAGYRAVQSTPLITSSGRLVGAASTVFARPHVPSRLDMLMMQLYARLAADIIARLVPPGRNDSPYRAPSAA